MGLVGAHGEAPGLVRRQREGGNCGQKTLLSFSQERTGETGKAGLGLATLNNFIQFLGLGAVPSCLVPGPEVSRAGG